MGTPNAIIQTTTAMGLRDTTPPQNIDKSNMLMQSL
jgi:hypothetical protein